MIDTVKEKVIRAWVTTVMFAVVLVAMAVVAWDPKGSTWYRWGALAIVALWALAVVEDWRIVKRTRREATRT